jgi:hypothetical protein
MAVSSQGDVISTPLPHRACAQAECRIRYFRSKSREAHSDGRLLNQGDSRRHESDDCLRHQVQSRARCGRSKRRAIGVCPTSRSPTSVTFGANRGPASLAANAERADNSPPDVRATADCEMGSPAFDQTTHSTRLCHGVDEGFALVSMGILLIATFHHVSFISTRRRRRGAPARRRSAVSAAAHEMKIARVSASGGRAGQQ